MRHALLVVVAAVAGLGVVAACGDDGREAGAVPGGLSGTGQEGASRVAEGVREVPVSGRSFAFEPEEITVRAGEDVAIALSSEGSFHDLTIDELDTYIAAEQGATVVGRLRADEPGRYTFYCSVRGHRDAGMQGTLVVEA